MSNQITEQLVDAILNGDKESFMQQFNAALAAKVSDALDVKKVELASTLITPAAEIAEEPAEEIAAEQPEEVVQEETEELDEKYMGFAAVEKAVAEKGARDPAAVAAAIGRKKYGKEKFQAMARAGKKAAK